MFDKLGLIGWEGIEPAIMASLVSGQSVLFHGHPGTSKSDACAKISTALLGNKNKFQAYECPSINLDDLIGVFNPMDLGKGKLSFIETPLSVWGKTSILLDEINCLSLGTEVRLVDGRVRTLRQLVTEYGTEDIFWIWAYDKILDKVVPAEAKTIGIKKKKDKMLKITLDNGRIIRTTLDHLFMTRKGKYKKAENLKVGQSLMPFHYTDGDEDSWFAGYPKIKEPNSNYFKLAHHITAVTDANLYDTWGEGKILHHLNENPKDSRSKNLKYVTRAEHNKFHNFGLEGRARKKYLRDNNIDGWRDREETRLVEMRSKITPEGISKGVSRYREANPGEWEKKASKAGKQTQKNNPNLCRDNLHNKKIQKKAQTNSAKTRRTSKSFKAIKSQQLKDTWAKGGFDDTLFSARILTLKNRTLNIGKLIVEAGHKLTAETWEEHKYSVVCKGNKPMRLETIKKYFNSFEEFKQLVYYNHKIIKIETISDRKVSCLTVKKYKNFALDCGIFVHNCTSFITQAKLHELVRTKHIMGLKTDVKFVFAAVNPPEEYQTNFMSHPLASRFVCLEAPSIKLMLNEQKTQILSRRSKSKTTYTKKFKEAKVLYKKGLKQKEGISLAVKLGNAISEFNGTVSFEGRSYKKIHEALIGFIACKAIFKIGFTNSALLTLILGCIPEYTGLVRLMSDFKGSDLSYILSAILEEHDGFLEGYSDLSLEDIIGNDKLTKSKKIKILVDKGITYKELKKLKPPKDILNYFKLLSKKEDIHKKILDNKLINKNILNI